MAHGTNSIYPDNQGTGGKGKENIITDKIFEGKTFEKKSGRPFYPIMDAESSCYFIEIELVTTRFSAQRLLKDLSLEHFQIAV